MSSECPFCDVDQREIVKKNSLALAMYDKYPVADGHMLVVPMRHFSSYFEATTEEIQAMHSLIIHCRDILDATFHPDGYNIGVNIGQWAGQSVFHLHIHVIPRFQGDHPRPRGGVRNVIPWKGEYKKK
jgi:diadenosine tetraphosphate (Ap4A) HIT family hydrolase